MTHVTVSTKYQVVIPLEARRQMKIKPGTRMAVVVKGNVITLVPLRPLREMRGFLRGMDTSNIREKQDRI